MANVAGLFKLFLIVIATSVALMIFTIYRSDQMVSVLSVGGYPTVAIKHFGAEGWIAVSQVNAKGIIVFAQVGFGVIGFVQAGVGLLICLCQVGFGVNVIAQVGLGIAGFIGQGGGGLNAAGQGVFGFTDEAHIDSLSSELNRLFRAPWRRT